MNNKKNKHSKNKNTPTYRDINERKEEISKIINNLNTYKLTLEYDAIKELYKLFKTYIEHGESYLNQQCKTKKRKR